MKSKTPPTETGRAAGRLRIADARIARLTSATSPSSGWTCAASLDPVLRKTVAHPGGPRAERRGDAYFFAGATITVTWLVRLMKVTPCTRSSLYLAQLPSTLIGVTA